MDDVTNWWEKDLLAKASPWASEILPGKLWQSSMIQRWSDLDNIKPDVVVDCAGLDTVIPNYTQGLFDYICIGMTDGPLPTDMTRFKEVAACATSAILHGGKVLTHCAAGINRSGLMSGQIIYNLGLAKGQQIIDLIRAARPESLQNADFCQYLRELV